MALKSTGKFPRRDLAANRAYKMSEDRCECVFHAAYGRGTELLSFNRTWITERTFTARQEEIFDRRVAQNQWFCARGLKTENAAYWLVEISKASETRPRYWSFTLQDVTARPA